MSLTVASSNSNFEIVPEGAYVARCFKVIDLGTQRVEYMGEEKHQHKVLIVWELLDDEVKMADGRPFAATRKYTATLDERGNLRRDLEAWRGKKFTDMELDGFDLKNVLGTYCMLQIVHTEDGKYANINSIMSTKEKPTPVNELVYFDVDHPDMEVFEKLSDKLQEQIKASPEFSGSDWPSGQEDPDEKVLDAAEKALFATAEEA